MNWYVSLNINTSPLDMRDRFFSKFKPENPPNIIIFFSFQAKTWYRQKHITPHHISNTSTCCLFKSVWVRDYVQYNEDKFGYVIEIIDNNNVQIREAIETRRVTIDGVKTNTICVVPLAGSKPSIDQNMRQPSSPQKDENLLR